MPHPLSASLAAPAPEAVANASDPLHPLLQKARASAAAQGLVHAGGVAPREAWQLVQEGAALLIDVRSGEERKFVGQVPGSLHVAWASGTALTRNPRFARELEAKARKDQPLLLLCRSGKRSVLAAEAAAKAGFTQAYNVLEGFEGELDALQQRGRQDGWRYHGLPWIQD